MIRIYTHVIDASIKEETVALLAGQFFFVDVNVYLSSFLFSHSICSFLKG